jgi:hypothetical protein
VIHKFLRWQLVAQTRRLPGRRFAREEWEALCAWQGVVHQAYRAKPIQPNLSSDLWHRGHFSSSLQRKPFFTPSRREREPSSHHYGHDVVLKRHAELPLIGPPLPLLLEHGLKVAETSRFETPKSWANRGYLCMGPLRARWLQEQHGVAAHPIGPWIQYARPLLDPLELEQQRQSWGSTMLVILAHSWDQVERSTNLEACVHEVQEIQTKQGYQQVVWLRHWKDPEQLPLPKSWIVACNGHRSNPWFLDALRTLLELCDGVATNAFGTHLGYAAALNKQLHWIPVQAEQNLSELAAAKADEEACEWAERQRLSEALRTVLDDPSPALSAQISELLDPYWGMSIRLTPTQLRELIRR